MIERTFDGLMELLQCNNDYEYINFYIDKKIRWLKSILFVAFKDLMAKLKITKLSTTFLEPTTIIFSLLRYSMPQESGIFLTSMGFSK